jgi:hypothetical protein
MIEAIRQRIKEVNESINTQLDLRKKLEDHIEWFSMMRTDIPGKTLMLTERIVRKNAKAIASA